MKLSFSPRAEMIFAACSFGSVGLLVRQISLPSSVIACVRGAVGMAFLLLVLLLRKQPLRLGNKRRNLPLLLLSGAAIGINWILLFEAYRYTTVAIATLCHYLAPVFVILISPLVLKEKLSAKKCVCAAGALLGMVFVSGVMEGAAPAAGHLTGIALGTGAAVLYAASIVVNKKLPEVSGYDKTLVQLGAAAVVVLPYILLTEDVSSLMLTPKAALFLLILSVYHTGICYALYFDALDGLSTQTAGILSYLNPVVAILLSALVLREPLGLWGTLGAALILGSTFVSELSFKKDG